MVLRNGGAAICPRLCPYELISNSTPSSLGLQDGSCVLWTRGRKYHQELLVETGAGPGLRWPTMLADVLFLLQRLPCWLPGPRHGTSSPPKSKSVSCCSLELLSQGLSGWEGVLCHQPELVVGSLSPLPCPVHTFPRLHLFLHCLPGKGLPQCTGHPVVREATLVSPLRGAATEPLPVTALRHTGDKHIPVLTTQPVKHHTHAPLSHRADTLPLLPCRPLSSSPVVTMPPSSHSVSLHPPFGPAPGSSNHLGRRGRQGQVVDISPYWVPQVTLFHSVPTMSPTPAALILIPADVRHNPTQMQSPSSLWLTGREVWG